MKFEKLVFVSADKNSNKEYIMEEKGDGTFDATFNRVGVSPQVTNYSMRKLDSKLREKLNKGYKRVTDLVSEVKSHNAKLTGETTIDYLLQRLLQASQEAFNATYRVAATSVTPLQVAEVQRLINQITAISRVSTDPTDTHMLFQELWTVLPRTMRNVRDALPRSMDSVKKQLEFEQDSIDNANVQKAFVSTDDNTSLLDNLGIQLSPRLTDIPTELEQFLGTNLRLVNSIYKLTKPDLDQRFQAFVSAAKHPSVEYRYHGTKWRNGMPILQTGLRILGAKSSTYSGSMLGDAIYTSKDFQKSLNYSDGLMFVLQVHTGNPLYIKTDDQVRHYTWEELQRLGYDSVNADPGIYTGWVTLQRHEQTIYNEAQQTFAYLLTTR